jgi:hypothetical protein
MVEENIDELGVKDILKKIYVQNQEDKAQAARPKLWRLPRKARLNKKLLKKNYTTVLIINENRNVDAVKLPIEDGCIMVDDVPRMATEDYTLIFNGKPMIVLPSWSLKPFSPEENYEETVKENLTIAGRKLILAKMKLEAVNPKKKGGGGMIGWIILGLAILGIAYYFIKGGKLV